jgi:hypothetical protein
MKDLRSSDEDSHIVKIEKPNERNKRRESEVSRRASAGRGGFSLFQAVSYLTGDMKECKNWLKGECPERSKGHARGNLSSSLDNVAVPSRLVARIDTVKGS